MIASGLARAMCVRHDAIGRTTHNQELANRAVDMHWPYRVHPAPRNSEAAQLARKWGFEIVCWPVEDPTCPDKWYAEANTHDETISGPLTGAGGATLHEALQEVDARLGAA